MFWKPLLKVEFYICSSNIATLPVHEEHPAPAAANVPVHEVHPAPAAASEEKRPSKVVANR